jgi:hypothetical protein
VSVLKPLFLSGREHKICFEGRPTAGCRDWRSAINNLPKVISKQTISPAVSEIRAYLSARNLLLREAEENTTPMNLARATTANEFAEECLGEVRPPYQDQALSETEAERERQHCKAVKRRLAELRARLGLRRRAA